MEVTEKPRELRWRTSSATGEDYHGIHEDLLTEICRKRDDGFSIPQTAQLFNLPVSYVRAATARAVVYMTTEEKDFLAEGFHHSEFSHIGDFLVDLIVSGIQQRGLVRVPKLVKKSA